jgi:hypothetical protein
MNIKNADVEVVRKARAVALGSGVTLRDWVMEAMRLRLGCGGIVVAGGAERGGKKDPSAKVGGQRRLEEGDRKAGNERPSEIIEKGSAKVLGDVSAVKGAEPERVLIPGFKCECCQFPVYEDSSGMVKKWKCANPKVTHAMTPRKLPTAGPVSNHPVDFDPEELV